MTDHHISSDSENASPDEKKAAETSELAPYDYELPDYLIAQSPLRRREDARMMVVDRQKGTIDHCYIRDLPRFLRSEDSLVLNNTRVVPARLIGRREGTGGRWEGLFLRFGEKGVWEVLSKTRGKLRNGETILLEDSDGGQSQRLEVVARTEFQTLLVRPLTEDDPLVFLDRVGWVPIPPYIRSGRMVPEDRVNYQTVYASEPGAVAAPTAGLHFTRPLLEKIRSLGVALCSVTLHVGIGTFKPITTTKLADHHMHSEWASISEEVVRLLLKRREAGGRIVAVGTTSVRTLESAANADENGKIDSTGNNDLSLRAFSGETDLFIRPPYRFKATDALLTNFHLPKSTLIILVRTFGGDDLLKKAYQEAIKEDYRFYSYGDAMLIL